MCRFAFNGQLWQKYKNYNLFSDSVLFPFLNSFKKDNGKKQHLSRKLVWINMSKCLNTVHL